MWIVLAYILAFVAVVMIVQAAASMVFQAGHRSRRVNRRLDLLDSGLSRDQVFEALVRRKPQGALASAAPGLYDRVANYFRQAGVMVTPQRFVISLAALAGLAIISVFIGLSIA